MVAETVARAGALVGVPARAAFLDQCGPRPGEALRELADRGVIEAVVVPLLFTDAFHARVDAPAAIRAAASASGVDVVTADALGTGESIARLLAVRADLLDHERRAHVVVYAVGSSDASANAAVRGLAAAVGRIRGTSASAGFATATRPRGGDAVPARGPVVVVPLFTAPGLLLDRLAADIGAVDVGAGDIGAVDVGVADVGVVGTGPRGPGSGVRADRDGRVVIDRPLGVDLAPVIAVRHLVAGARAALPASG